MKPLFCFAVLASLVACPAFVHGQFAFVASNEAAFPGDVVTAAVDMDNSSPARGLSFGMVHDALVLTLTDIRQGAVLQASNGGAGADFFFGDTNPPGGPGGVVGCIVSLDVPLEEIPAGTAQEVVLLDYNVSGAAAPGTGVGGYPVDGRAGAGAGGR